MRPVSVIEVSRHKYWIGIVLTPEFDLFGGWCFASGSGLFGLLLLRTVVVAEPLVETVDTSGGIQEAVACTGVERVAGR